MGLTHLLDSNICIYIINYKPLQVRAKFREYRLGEVGLSSIVLAELAFGVSKSKHADKNYAALEVFLADLEVVAFDELAAWRYGSIRATLERKGTPIGALDLQIAAHALELGATLVTNNTAEFSRVEGLKLENWI